MALPLPSLPIRQITAELKQALAHGSAVLAAPPGSGKTTIVPLELLDEPWLAGRTILLIEPRRLAARAAASRLAALLGEQVGQTVGYQIRFDRRIGPATRIEVVTEGILTRRLQDDAGLDNVGLIVFDEFHERSLHADLALALCLDLCQLREDLRLLVMSATLDTGRVAALLGDVPVIIGAGRQHEVRVEYLERPANGRIGAIAASHIRRAAAELAGDILVFLPGAGEIREAQGLLADDPSCRALRVLPLFGDLPQTEQDRAILPDPEGRRRVILATSIAETSLTIEGIGCVVDSGWSRRPGFDPGSGLDRLITVRVSRAATRQRAGRAGRLGPGVCLRLWTRHEHHSLPPFHPPEIHSVDLAGLALELALWGAAGPGELRWLDPPRSGPYRQARELLHTLGALDAAGRITDLGRQLATLPLHPRLAHMLLKARATGQTGLACDLAALLTERDPLRHAGPASGADLGQRLDLLHIWRSKGDAATRQQGGEPSLCRRIDQAAHQWHRLLGGNTGPRDHTRAGTLLAHAYPERIARRRSGQRERYQLSNGRGATLPPGDLLAASEYLVAPRLNDGNDGEGEGRIFLAASLALEDLRRDHPDLLTLADQVGWDDALGRVSAVRQNRLGAIVIEERPLGAIDPAAVTEALLDGIRKRGIGCLPWDREARRLQARIDCVRAWEPEGGWPDVGDAALAGDLGRLEPYLAGIDRIERLARLDLRAILTGMLDWPQRQRLDRLAPETFAVPSGSKIRIDYEAGAPPFLAVRLQELFGLLQTPAICDGRIPLVLHLLSPARRPIQVTTDLAGFWQRGYAEVKKELKGRYPKHFWPDDPRTAEATRGSKRRP